MRVVVTGAGGFIGRVVACRLASFGHNVIAIYRNSRPRGIEHEPRIEPLGTDLRALKRLPAIDGVVHCAADVPALCPQEDELYHSNVEGTRTLFSIAHAAGARRIVYLSSMAIYGAVSAKIVQEDLPSNNPDNYGRSKLEGENLLKTLCGQHVDVGGLAIRLPGVVGAGARNNFLADALAKILRREQIWASNPDAIFNNVIHVDDLASFIVDRLETMVAGYTVTNIASREPLRLREIVALLYACSGRNNDAQWRSGHGQPFTISLARVERLGYSPRIVRDTVERFVRDEISTQGGWR